MFTRNVVMKKVLFALVGGVVLAAVSGCVVAPYPATGPAYVEPYYPSPGVSWVWQFNPSYGWGWHHPQHGWHNRGGGYRGDRGHR
ncbi:MAG: hypothetical protein H6R07_2852 [Proteobacteria bacterium]|nr:hypothetical protein [Pseudomonadota bacterium]